MDDDDRLHGSIVAGTGVLDHLYVLDVVRLDVAQFVQVGQFAVVQIDKRSALAQDFVAVALLRDGGHTREYVLSRA